MEEPEAKEKATNSIFWTGHSYCNHELTANVAASPALMSLDLTTVSHGWSGAHRSYPFPAELLTAREVATGELTRLQAIF